MPSKGKLKNKANRREMLLNRLMRERALDSQEQTLTDIEQGEPGAADLSTDDEGFQTAIDFARATSKGDSTNQFFSDLDKQRVIDMLLQRPLGTK